FCALGLCSRASCLVRCAASLRQASDRSSLRGFGGSAAKIGGALVVDGNLLFNISVRLLKVAAGVVSVVAAVIIPIVGSAFVVDVAACEAKVFCTLLLVVSSPAKCAAVCCKGEKICGGVAVKVSCFAVV